MKRLLSTLCLLLAAATTLPAGDHVARSEPDGYTFFLASNTPMMQVPLLKKHPPYDPVKSFTPVSLVGRYVYVLVSSPALPVKDVAELLAYARANPGKLGYGSYSGVTQLMHTNLKMVKADTNLVPYKGEAPTVTDVLGNHVQFTFATPAVHGRHLGRAVRAGQAAGRDHPAHEPRAERRHPAPRGARAHHRAGF